jgi:hypothetical protein
MGIFRQNWHFSKVLIVWRARVQVLIIQKAFQNMTDILKG